MPILTTIIQNSFGTLTTEITEEKKKSRRNPDCKRSKFADDMILYIENPKDATRKLIQPINEYSKVTEYKINT